MNTTAEKTKPKTFRLDPQVYMTAARIIEKQDFHDANVAIQAAAKHHCPEDVDQDEFRSAHLALLYYAYAPGDKTYMRCTRAPVGERRWFCVGCDLSAAAIKAHPWWGQRKEDVTPKIRAVRVAALENLAQTAARFQLPNPDVYVK